MTKRLYLKPHRHAQTRAQTLLITDYFLLSRGFRFTRRTGSAQAARDNAPSPTHCRLLLTSSLAVSTVCALANSLLSSFPTAPCFRTRVARTRRKELGIFYVFKVPILLDTEYHPWESQQEKGQWCGSSFAAGIHYDVFMGLQLGQGLECYFAVPHTSLVSTVFAPIW